MKKILYVDDNFYDLDAAKRDFSNAGIPIVCTDSPAEAMALLKDKPDGWMLVISDLIMPGDDGLYFAENMEAEHINVPYYFVSGVERMQRFENYQGLKNYKGFILKPLTPEKVESLIGGALDAMG